MTSTHLALGATLIRHLEKRIPPRHTLIITETIIHMDTMTSPSRLIDRQGRVLLQQDKAGGRFVQVVGEEEEDAAS